MPTKEEVISSLETVQDPEFHVDVWNLGLIYDIVTKDDSNSVNVKMTLTTPTCPAAGPIIAEVKAKVASLLDGGEVNVDLVFDPPWEPTMMTRKGRKMLPSQTFDFIDFDL